MPYEKKNCLMKKFSHIQNFDWVTSSNLGILKPNGICLREHFENMIKNINPPSKYIADSQLNCYVIVWQPYKLRPNFQEKSSYI